MSVGKRIEIDEAGDMGRGQIRKSLCVTHEKFSYLLILESKLGEL